MLTPASRVRRDGPRRSVASISERLAALPQVVLDDLTNNLIRPYSCTVIIQARHNHQFICLRYADKALQLSTNSFRRTNYRMFQHTRSLTLFRGRPILFNIIYRCLQFPRGAAYQVCESKAGAHNAPLRFALFDPFLTCKLSGLAISMVPFAILQVGKGVSEARLRWPFKGQPACISKKFLETFSITIRLTH